MRRLLVLLPFVPVLLVACHSLGRHLPTTLNLGNTPTSAGNPPSGCHYRGRGLYALPDHRCSPGALNPAVRQSTIGSTICRSGYTSTIRPSQDVTGPEKLVEMRAYGLHGSPHPYELDHLISLELGGAANSYKNYYPEPNYPNAHGFYLNPKDKLENVLKHRICDGKTTLRAAQLAISTDWVAAYKRYG